MAPVLQLPVLDEDAAIVLAAGAAGTLPFHRGPARERGKESVFEPGPPFRVAETQYAVPETTPSNSTPLLAPEDTLPGLPPFPGPAPSGPPSGPPSDTMSPMTAAGLGGIGSSATLGGALGGTLGGGGFAFTSSASDKGSSLHSRKGSLSDDGLKTKRVGVCRSKAVRNDCMQVA